MKVFKITYKTYLYGMVTRVAIMVAKDREKALEYIKEEPVYSKDPDAVIVDMEEVDLETPGCVLISTKINQ